MALTAAHCIRGFDSTKLEFVLGSDSEKPIQRAPVYRADVHQDYDESRLGVNDIGFVYLGRHITEASPVQLPDGRLPRTTNLSLLYVGFGISGPKAGARRCVDIPIQDVCDDTFSHATKHLNTCHGDSGGAAFRDIGEKQLLLAGLTGWGDETCEDFGVDINIGYHRDWIKARMSEAPRATPPAVVEPRARKSLGLAPDDLMTQLQYKVDAEERFESTFKGRWITWAAKVTEVLPRASDSIPGACNVLAKAGQRTNLLLWEYPDGCSLEANQAVRFTGRLVRLRPGNVVDVSLVEPVQATAVSVMAPVGEYTLIQILPQTQDVRERRSRDVRVESRHGSWSGRVSECVPVQVESPWRLDKSAPINFSIAYTNHAGYLGAIQNPTDEGFCVPLWAEGFGGVQVFGATVDAGMAGVISGTIEFGVLKTETAAARVSVGTGVIPARGEVNIPFPGEGQYELHLKLRDGTEQIFRASGTLGGVAVNWSDQKVELRVN